MTLVLLKGPREGLFLMSEVPLYTAARGRRNFFSLSLYRGTSLIRKRPSHYM